MTYRDETARFELIFLQADRAFAYTYDEWQTIVGRLDPARRIVTITEFDVRLYEVVLERGRSVTLHLTTAGVDRLRAARHLLHEVPVLVRLDGAVLYAAKEYSSFGAAAIEHPVVHLDRLSNAALEIRGSLGWVHETASRRIDRPELRELFRVRGGLSETQRR